MDNNKKSVFRNFTLIMQLGLNVMVPIALCVAVGVLIDNHFGTYWTIPLIFLGMAAGARNAYRLAMASVREDEKHQPEENKKESEDGSRDDDDR